MRNPSKMIYEQAVANSFKQRPQDIRRSKKSTFLDLEVPHLSPTIKTYRLFDECSDYIPDKEFVNKPY